MQRHPQNQPTQPERPDVMGGSSTQQPGRHVMGEANTEPEHSEVMGDPFPEEDDEAGREPTPA